MYILGAASVGRLQDFQKMAVKAEKKTRFYNTLLVGFFRTVSRSASANVL